MLNPIITEYIAADRTDEAHRHADHARLVREVRTGNRASYATRPGTVSRVPSRWRAWGWSLAPRV